MKESLPVVKILLEFLESYTPIIMFLQDNSLTVIVLKLKPKAIKQALIVAKENVSVRMIT